MFILRVSRIIVILIEANTKMILKEHITVFGKEITYLSLDNTLLYIISEKKSNSQVQ